MWCTICHTAFSWKTGKEEFNIHNPHAFEYYRTIRIQIPPGPIRVGDQEVTMFDVRMRFALENPNYDMMSFPSWIENLARCKIHVREVTIRKMQTFIDTKNIITAIDIIKYTCNEIDLKELERVTVKRKNIIERLEGYIAILQTFNTVVNDLLGKINTVNVHIILDETKAFIKHINKAFEDCEAFSKKKPLLYIDRWLFYVQEQKDLIDIVDWINGQKMSRL
jgi:hypothetical protein